MTLPLLVITLTIRWPFATLKWHTHSDPKVTKLKYSTTAGHHYKGKLENGKLLHCFCRFFHINDTIIHMIRIYLCTQIKYDNMGTRGQYRGKMGRFSIYSLKFHRSWIDWAIFIHIWGIWYWSWLLFHEKGDPWQKNLPIFGEKNCLCVAIIKLIVGIIWLIYGWELR